MYMTAKVWPVAKSSLHSPTYTSAVRNYISCPAVSRWLGVERDSRHLRWDFLPLLLCPLLLGDHMAGKKNKKIVYCRSETPQGGSCRQRQPYTQLYPLPHCLRTNRHPHKFTRLQASPNHPTALPSPTKKPLNPPSLRPGRLAKNGRMRSRIAGHQHDMGTIRPNKCRRGCHAKAAIFAHRFSGCG